MTKIVNSWDEWSPLRRVIMGRPEGTNVTAPDASWWMDCPAGGYPLGSWGPFPQEMVDAANEQMDYFEAQLVQRGVIIDRLEVQDFMFNKPLSSPTGWTIQNAYGVNNPRDVTLIHGNAIIEAAVSRRSRHYERYNLRPIFERYFKEDPELVHFAAPPAMLTDESYTRNYFYDFRNVWSDEVKRQRLHDREFQLSEKEPLWDAADCMRFGKDIVMLGSSVTNKAGLDWVKRMFAALGVRVHLIEFDTPWPMGPDSIDNYHPWHIDTSFIPLRPGLALTNPDWPPRTPEFFELLKKNDWELVTAVKSTHQHNNAISHSHTGVGRSWIGLNTLSLDEKTIFADPHEPAYLEQLSALGFEVIEIPYDKVVPFGGMLHCTTLDVYRESECRDYFPNQVPGY
jgi:glycine amidinotransferase